MRVPVAFGVTVDDPALTLGTVIAGSHQMTARVDVLFDRAVIEEGIAVAAGSVTSDRAASILSSCHVAVADPLRAVDWETDTLTPYGYELRIWRGVVVDSGEIMCPLGVFPIQRSSMNDSTLVTTITGQDRGRLVSDAIFEQPYSIASGTNYATAIEDMIDDGVSGLVYSLPSTPYTTPLLTFGPDDNRWSSAQRMARSIGNELLFDGLGVCTMRPEPTFSADPVATIAEGENLLAPLVVDMDRTPAFNKVIATSSNASLDDQYRGEAEDDDPASPTYYDGPFGKKARRYSSPFLASNAQCDSAAAAVLASNLGVAKSVSARMLTNPCLETSDVVQVTRTAIGLDDELHIIEQVTLGLTADQPMTASVRAQQAAS